MTEEEFIDILKTGSFKERFDAVSRADPAYFTHAVSDNDENISYNAKRCKRQRQKYRLGEA
jgi:hypothetical protein